MRAAAKGEMLHIFALNIEFQRIGVHFGIVMHAEQRHMDRIALFDRLVGNLHILMRAAQYLRHRRFDAQDFVHRIVVQIGPRAEFGQLVGMLEQLHHARPQHIGGGRIARDEQQADQQHDILRRQAVALLLRLRKAGDQVVARLAPADIDFARQIVGKHGGRFLVQRCLFGRAERVQRLHAP